MFTGDPQSWAFSGAGGDGLGFETIPPDGLHPTAQLSAEGNLIVFAAQSAEHDNELLIRNDGNGNLIITDALLTFLHTGHITGATLSEDQHTLTVPLSSIVGTEIIVNGGAGNDELTADLIHELEKTLTYHGGAQTSATGDLMLLTGDTAELAVYRFLNENDGSVEIDGQLLNYTGLEPVNSTINATNVDLFYSTANETITVTAGAAGVTNVDSTAGESVAIPNPSGRLHIHAGNVGDDLILVEGVGSGFAAHLMLNGGTGTDVVSFGGAAALTLGGNLTISAETVNQTQPLTVTGATTLQAHDYATEVLNDNPAIYYRLNETSGTTAAPTLGALNGTFNGGMTLGGVGPLTGNLSNLAPAFDGTDDYVLLANGTTGLLPASLFSDGTYSVELWFRSTAGTATLDMVAMTSAADNNHGILLESVGTRRIRYLHRSPAGTGGGQQINPSTQAYTNNVWSHLVVVNDGSQMRLYLNGVQDATTAVPTAAINFALNAVLGRISPTSSSRYWNGGLDEYAVYAAALTPEEIQAHFASAGGVTNVTLTNAANNFVGAVSVGGGGNVQLTDANDLVLGPAAIATSLTLSAPGNITQTAPITGAGALIKTGTGTLTLLSVNTYTGSTTVTQGTLRLGSANAIPATTALTVGTGTTVGTFDLNNFNQTVASLSSTSNAAGFNVIDIDAGRTLTVNGNVVLSNNTDGAQTNMNMVGGGSLVANGTNFFVGNNTTAATSKARLNLSALAAVNITMSGAITVQADGDNGPADFAILTLSNTANTLIAPTLTVGASATGALNQLILGDGTNVIRVNTFNIGTGSRDAGSVTFASAAGTVQVRNQAGTGRATFNLGTGSANTGITAANAFDVTGHNADLLLGAVTIGTQPRSFNWSSTFSFDTGTLDMTSLTLGTTTQTTESGNGAGIARITNAVFNIGGGNVNIANGVLKMGEVTGTGYTDAAKPHTVNATINISGGNVNIGATNGNSIVMSTLNVTGATNVAALASNAVLNISGGTTTLAGDIMRGTVGGTSTGGLTTNSAINLTGGTLNMGGNDVGTLAQPIVFSKSTAGTASFIGASSYFGPAAVTGGTLFVNGFIGQLTIDAGTTLRPGNGPVPGPGLGVVIGDYVQNGALAIEITSPTGIRESLDYDSLKVIGGSVSIGAAATLSVTYTGAAGTFTGNTGQLYTLIDNDGSVPADTAGTFAGLPEGATITVDGRAMRLSYVGGDGNDVVLTAVTGNPITTIYVDDDFPASGTVDGNLEAAGSQNATMGTTAFSSIAAALAAHPTYAGLIIVNGGTYASAALAGGTGITLRLVQDLINAEPDVTLQSLSGDANDTIVTRHHNAAGGNLIVEQGTFAGLIAGSGDFSKTTTGTLTLTGTNSYFGSTNVTGGTLTLAVANALPATTTVTVGTGASTGTLDVNANQTIAGLFVRSNTATFNTIDIGPSTTLLVNGTNALSIGVQAVGQVTNVNFIGGGTLDVTNDNAGTTVFFGLTNTNQNSTESDVTVDMRALGNVILDVDNVRVGYNSRIGAVVRLSDTANTINANLLSIGDSTNNNAGSPIRVELGTGTNVLQVNTLTVAAGKGSAALQFASQVAGSPGTISILGRAGGAATTNINVGVNTQTDTAANITGTIDLRGHVSTVQAGTVILGRSTRGSNSSGATGNLLFDAGTFSVNTLSIADKSGAATGAVNGNLTIGGGTFTINTGGLFRLGLQAAAASANATVNLNGGTLVSNVPITDGGGTTTSTLNISGGTLNMRGNPIGTAATSIDAIALESGAIRDVAEINGGAPITKTTAGTLEILGTNGFTGATTVAAGTLKVNGLMAASATTVQTGATLTGTGTTGPLTVNAGGTHAPGDPIGVTTVTGNYTESGALQIQLGSPTGNVPGTDFDQVKVVGGGSVAIAAGATLSVTYTGAAGTFAPGSLEVYVLIDNDGTAPADTIGTFAGLAAGATVTVDGKAMTIQYNGGDGNDVVLVAPVAPITTLYVNNQFTGSGPVDGDLEAGGTQSATIGTTAFASIAAALTAHPGFNGTIIVNGGTYPSALLAGGGNVTLRLVQDLANGEPNVTFSSLSGDSTDAIITRFYNAANANLIVTAGSFAGVISGSGEVIKNTTGTVTLSGTNTYTGLTTVAAGTLTITNASALGTAAGATTVNSGAQLQLSGGITVASEQVTINAQGTNSQGALNNLAGNNTWAGPIVIGTGATNNRVGSTAGNLTLSGVISGGQVGSLGGLTVRNGAGTTIVSGGANTYLGDTTIVVGTLRIAGGDNRLPITTKLAIGNTASVTPAQFDLGGFNQTVGGLYSIDSTMVIEVTNSGALATLTVNLPTGTDTYNGIITGAVNLTKTGAGALALGSAGGNGSNTFTGTTLVSGGRLHLNKTAGQNAIPSTLNITTGGAVSFGARNQIADTASVNVSGVGSVFQGSGFNAGQLANLQETIANLTVTGGTFQTGSGSTWNITGTGSFTGGAGNTIFLGNSGTTISFGALSLTDMTATPGATVQTNNSFAIYGASSTPGTVSVGAGGLTLNNSVFNLRKSSTAGQAGSRLVLNGPVVATGASNSSIILDTGGGTIGIANVELSGTAGPANRNFDVTAGSTLTVSVPISNGAATPGSITKIGAGTLVLSGANTFTGTTAANAGTLQLAGGAAILDTAGAVSAGLGGTLQLLANETVSSFSGAGDIGAGTNDGTLALGNFTLTTTGNAAIANVTVGTAGGITAGGAITDSDDDNNVTGTNLVLQAASGIGTAANPIETTLANLEASGGTGGVFIANSGNLILGGISPLTGVSATGTGINVSSAGSLTVNENVAGTGAGTTVTLSTIDAATTGQDLLLAAAATVSSANSSVTLNAGDNATLAGNIASSTTSTINVDATSADALGGTLTLTGAITAPGGAFLNGDINDDTFNVRPQTAAALTIDGRAPFMTATGDVLNLDMSTATGQALTLGSIGSGVWTFNAPLQSVSYISIEVMNANAPFHLSLDANTAFFGNTGVADEITVRQSGPNLVVERTGATTAPDNDDVGILFQGAIAPILSFTYTGSGDDDVVTVSDVGGLPQFAGTAPSVPDNANLAGIASILFDGNGGTDALVFNLTGANAAQSYAIGNGAGAAGLEGEVRAVSGGLSLQTYFVDAESTQRTGTGATPGALQIIGDANDNSLAVTPTSATTSVTATGYAPFVFSGNNYTQVNIAGLTGADTLELLGFGTGQTNNPAVNLTGGLGDDTLRVHSTSGQTGIVTLTGDAGNDLILLSSSTNTIDAIAGPVIVDGSDGIVAGNDDQLVIVDTGDSTGDSVLIGAVDPATSADYRIEGITSTTGNDVILRNIDTLTYSGTQGNDTLDAQFVSTTPMHDLSIATLNGWTGSDQFFLFTSDQIGGTVPTPTGVASGLAIINLNGDASGNPNPTDGNDVFGQTPPGLTGTGAGNAGLPVATTVDMIRPSVSTAININGGEPTAPVGTTGDIVGDVLNLDISGLPTSVPLILATVSGVVASSGLSALAYGQIEDLNLILDNQLANVQMGDTLVRATSTPDTIIFSRNPTPSSPTNTRVRLNSLFVDFPMYGKTLTYAGGGNDYVTHANVSFPMESHGEDGNDYIAGGLGNDLLVGGLGNDQINANIGDNIVIGDELLSGSAVPLPQDSDVGGNDVLSALGGNDVFYGGGGNDQVSPGAGNDYLHGGAGDDTLDGSTGDDRLYGGAGNDILSGSAGNDLLSGGDGNDLLLGLDGNDVLIGGLGADNLNGGDGDDLLISGSVANELSSWTSSPVTATFDANLYSRPADNDAALLVLLSQWSTTGNRSSLTTITDDGALDSVWGYTGNDDFATTPGEPQDFNSPGMGTDELF